MFVAVLKIHLFFPDTGSLKGKRAELRPVKHALTARLGCAIAEVEHHDTWQRSTLGAALVGQTEHEVSDHADAVCRWLDSRLPQGVRVERSIASWTDLAD